MSPAPPRLDAFAVAAPGVEPWLARELEALGSNCQAGEGGVAFAADLAGVYRVNLHSRLASRVIVRVAEFRARALGELARRAAAVPWDDWIASGTTVRLRVSARKSRLYHTGAIAERIAEGLAARVPVTLARTAPEEAADDDGGSDALLLLVRIAHDVCTISLDSSGDLLHRRGYRQAVAKAPLRETLAAALLAASGWNPNDGLSDPFCGSGTIAIEAALLSRGIAPGLQRRFAFERWPRHDPGLWEHLRDEARAMSRAAAAGPIHASDRDGGAVVSAIANAGRAGVENDIAIVRAPLSAAPFGPAGAWIVTNPPYGVRVGEAAGLRDLYATLGRRVRDEARRLVLLSADAALERQLHLRLETVLSTRNGGIPVRVRRRAMDLPER